MQRHIGQSTALGEEPQMRQERITRKALRRKPAPEHTAPLLVPPPADTQDVDEVLATIERVLESA